MPDFWGSEFNWKAAQARFKYKCDKLAKRYPNLTRAEVRRVVERKCGRR